MFELHVSTNKFERQPQVKKAKANALPSFVCLIQQLNKTA